MAEQSGSLEVRESLISFFFERVGEAQQRCRTTLATEVEAYVVHLLSDFVRRTGVAGRKSPPLALQYLSARQAGVGKTSALREVGDRALFIAGAVPHSLDRTPVNVRYVRGIGEAAYREVAEGRAALAVFEELAAAFGEASEVIGEVVEAGGESRGDLLGLYERWRRHGDPRDARRLSAAGVLLGAHGSDIPQ
ncbi:MAG TPA: hypothetical protein PKW35_07755 [Nannocystaceae bacterium]|nr:hypothetical protein [Nannocystaceae bacterium]